LGHGATIVYAAERLTPPPADSNLIDKLKDDYGAPKSGPRHPDLESGHLASVGNDLSVGEH
jgi:hypothetical protein